MRLSGLKLLFLLLLGLVAALAIGVVAHEYPGHMILRVAGWRIETSFSFFAIVFILGVVLLFIVLRILVGLWRLPGRLIYWRRERRRLRSENHLRQGLLALIEGDWPRAEKLLQKGAPDSRAPLINYLGAARAAQEQGALERRDSYLRLAHDHSPNADIVIGIAQAQLQMNQHQTEQALATLKHLYDQRPEQSHIKQLLVQTYSEVGDWEAVLQLLPQLARKKLMSKEALRELEIRAYIGMLRRAGAARQRDALDAVWRDIPRGLRTESQLLEVYVEQCLHLGRTDGCEELLRRALKKEWQPQLIAYYGQIEAPEPDKQLRFAEGFLKDYPRDPALLLAVGRLSIRNGLWGKARSYLEQCIEVQPQPEAYRELADLLRQQGEHAAASRYYQQGLILATGGNRPDDPRQLEHYGNEAEAGADAARRVV